MDDELKVMSSGSIEWYKDLQYQDVKGFIRDNINSASRSFVAIGYYLKYVRDLRLFIEDGYQSIWGFAKGEYGIGKSSASQFMSINDKFSKDGNSPILQEQFKDFSSSKLAEMLTLSDEQMEQITPTTTIVEIRQIKKPVSETVLTSEQEPEAEEVVQEQEEPLSIMGLPKTVYPPDSSMTTAGCGHKYDCYTCHREGCGIRQEDCWCIDAPCGNPFPCDILKNDIDVVEQAVGDSCQFFNLELVDPEWIRAGDKEPVPCCKHCSNQCEYVCKRAKQLHKPEPKTQELTVDDLDLSIRTYNLLKRADIHTVNDLTELTETDALHILNVTQINIDEIKERLAEHGLAFMTEEEYRAEYKGSILDDIPVSANDTLANVDNQAETENDVDTLVAWENNCSNCKYDKMTVEEFKAINHDREHPCLECNNELNYWMPMGEEGEEEQEQVETVEADIIQTIPEDPEQYTFQDVKDEHDKLIEYVDTFRKNNDTVPGRRKAKMRLDAITLLAEEMQRPQVAEEPKPVQPELPILKNNDQRKEWAENYKAWGEWYYDEHIDCHYYKYDFTNGDRLVVEEYLNRSAYWGHEADRCHYHLLQKNKPAYEKNKTFEQKYVHAESSMTEIVEYLKNLQKKGA